MICFGSSYPDAAAAGYGEVRVSGLRFALLGTLTIAAGAEDPVAVSGARLRAVLASLLLSPNVPVSGDALVEAVWDGLPPPGAAAALRSHVRRLRAALGSEAGERIRARYPGYLISVQEPELDVLSFEAACRAASAARWAARWPEASAAAARALGLWRGTPLLDVPSQVLRDQFVPGLEQLRLQALEDRAEAELRLGRLDWLIPQLRELAAQHPMREQFHGQLMEALARTGRQAEAMEAYRNARRALVDNLGIEPGPHLQLLHQQILDGDPRLAAPPPAAPGEGDEAPGTALASSSPAGVPRQLPGTVPHFTGRSAELARLSQLLDQVGGQAPGTVVISAIGGTAGVGKTALAVHWAHSVTRHFPDGQLYLNLRGYDTAEPLSGGDALAVLLRSLGLAGADIPADQDERAARYRTLLAGRRVLLLLDNASGADQVRPLLPGTPGCLTLVTSRDSLAGLVARDGARRLDLDLLPPTQAVELLRALVGNRVDADPAAAMVLAQRCSRLPLALRVAAELAAARPQASLAAMASELAGQHGRLDLLDAGGDPRTAVRSVFSWSYQYLDADAGRGFQLMSLHPGTEMDKYAMAALTGSTVRHAEQILGQLTRAHLIHAVTAGSYDMHDLLRAYAGGLVATQLSETSRHAAVTALLDNYLHAASLAMDALSPGSKHLRPQVPPSAGLIPPIADQASARLWLDAHRNALVAVIAYAADHDWLGHAATLATTVFRDLEGSGHYSELLTIYEHVLPAARRRGDGATEAEALNNVCAVYLRQGDYPAARHHLERALALNRERGDLTGQSWTHGNLGILDFLQGRYPQATGHQSRAIELYARTGDHIGEIRSLLNLSLVELRQGRYQQATRHAALALTDARLAKAHSIEADALVSLGRLQLRQGHPTLAATHLDQALEIRSERGEPAGQADVLSALGALSQELGNYQQAADRYQRALDLARQTGDKCGQAEALNGLGESQLGRHRPERARIEHAAALELANQIGDLYEQARAHRGLARAYGADGETGEARYHWQEAARRYADLGTPEAGDEKPFEFNLAGSA
jgi:DNA-binding SARP family transcriptional activator/tetratricopeptide (TPR) repeat protein